MSSQFPSSPTRHPDAKSQDIAQCMRMRPDYVLVDASVGDKFVKALEETTHTFYGQDPKSSDGYGRIVNERSYARLHSMLDADRQHVTFGSVGNSGMGAYHGKFGFEAFSHRKPVMHKYSLLDLPQRYAPYSPASERVLRIVQYPFSRACSAAVFTAGRGDRSIAPNRFVDDPMRAIHCTLGDSAVASVTTTPSPSFELRLSVEKQRGDTSASWLAFDSDDIQRLRRGDRVLDAK